MIKRLRSKNAQEVRSSILAKASPVAQEHAMGCAVACVAFRGGLAYESALCLFVRREAAWTLGYYCVELVEALNRIGLRYRYEAFEPDKHPPLLRMPGTIVFVGPCEKYPAGHYLIRARRGWMNSWANFPRMLPPEAGFQMELPGPVEWVLFEDAA